MTQLIAHFYRCVYILTTVIFSAFILTDSKPFENEMARNVDPVVVETGDTAETQVTSAPELLKLNADSQGSNSQEPGPMKTDAQKRDAFQADESSTNNAEDPLPIVITGQTVCDVHMDYDFLATDGVKSFAIDVAGNDADDFTVTALEDGSYRLNFSKAGTYVLSAGYGDQKTEYIVTVEEPLFDVTSYSISEYEAAEIFVTGTYEDVTWATDSEDMWLYEDYDEDLGADNSCVVSFYSEVAGSYYVYASVNGQTFTFPITVTPHSETNATWVVVEEPTCVDSGLMAQVCDICGRTISSYVMDPTGHVPGDWETDHDCTCLEDGVVTRHCTQCGILLDSYEKNATGHVAGDWYTVQSPAPWSDGIQQRCCVYCGEVMDEATLSYTSVVMNDINNRGAIGRLNIPSLGIDVALFASNSQYICDCEDSANYFYYNGAYMICDHNYQGFSPLEWVSCGTAIYITTEYGTSTYYVTGSDYALYNAGRLYDVSGTVSFTQWMPSCSLILKTCASGGRDILVYCS